MLFQIFKLYGLSKFIDFIEAQFKAQNEELVKEDPNNAQTLSRKALISKVQNYLSIISSYSQKHMERIQRSQRNGYLVNFVVSKFTLEDEKLQLKKKFKETKSEIRLKKREEKALSKSSDESE